MLLELTLLVLLAVAAPLLAHALRIPSIVPLLAAGVLVGPSVAGVINPEKLLGDLLDPFVSLAVGVILFQGALGLRREDLGSGVRPVVLRLVTLGALVTWGVGAAAAALLLDVSNSLAILIGAVLIVSGPTVVLPILDLIRPTPRVRNVLRWEGIMVDPVGAITAVLVFTAVDTVSSDNPGVLSYFGTVGVGLLVGVIGAVILLAVVSSRRFGSRQQVLATLALVVAATGVADHIRDDAGLVSAIVMGLVMANQNRVPIGDIVEFKETLGTLLLGVLFVLLSALVSVKDVVGLGFKGILFVLVLVFVARPLVTLLCTARSQLQWRERVFIGWMAPRGIVAASTASTFSINLVAEGVAGAEKILPVTFLVVACTVVLYGLTGPPVARALGLIGSGPNRVLLLGTAPWLRNLGDVLRDQGINVDNWPVDGVPGGGPLLDDLDPEESWLGRTQLAIVGTGDASLDDLAAAELQQRIGMESVYGVAAAGERPPIVPEYRRARPLFEGEIDAGELDRRFIDGWRVTVVDDPRDIPTGALEIAVLRDSRVLNTERVLPIAKDSRVRAKSDDGIVVLAPPTGNEVVAASDRRADTA